MTNLESKSITWGRIKGSSTNTHHAYLGNRTISLCQISDRNQPDMKRGKFANWIGFGKRCKICLKIIEVNKKGSD